MWGWRMKEVFLSESLVHIPEVLQLREGQEALQQPRAGIAEVHLGQAEKVQAYSRGFQAEHTSGINIGMGRPREGERPHQGAPNGAGLPYATLGLSRTGPMREARMPGLAWPQALFIPIPPWPTSHLWLKAGTGVNQRTQGRSVSGY